MADITHELGKEAMMFLGDHWIGTEPYLDEFKSIGLDAVVGSVSNGAPHYRGASSSFPLELAANEIRWYEISETD